VAKSGHNRWIAVLCVDSKIVRFTIDVLVFLGYQFPNIKSPVVLVVKIIEKDLDIEDDD